MIEKDFDFLFEHFFGITAIPSFLCWLSKDKPNDHFQYSLAKPIVVIQIHLHDIYVRHSCSLVNNFQKSKKPTKTTSAQRVGFFSIGSGIEQNTG